MLRVSHVAAGKHCLESLLGVHEHCVDVVFHLVAANSLDELVLRFGCVALGVL